MSASAGPSLGAKNNLLFAYDQDNFKSFAGEPITNIVTNTNLDTGWSKGYCQDINLNDLSVQKPPGVKSAVVSFTNNPSTGGNACFWYSYGDYAPQADNTTYFMSVWARTNGQDFPVQAYTANNSETGRKSSEYITLVGDDTWQRLEWNAITTSNPNDSDSLSFRLYQNTTTLFPPLGQKIYLCAPQMTTTGHRPFVNGTRSNTQSLLDWAGGSTITSTALTYDSNNDFEFDGTDDYATVSDPSYPTAWTDNFSFEAWHYVPSGADWHDTTTFGANSGTAIVARGSYPGSHGLGRRDTNKLFHCVRTDSGLYFAEITASTNTWYHLVGTYDGTNNRLYVNGKLEATTAVTITGVPDTGGVRIGGNFAFGGNNGGYAQGKTPVARMYNKALSAFEVNQNFNAQRGRFGI